MVDRSRIFFIFCARFAIAIGTLVFFSSCGFGPAMPPGRPSAPSPGSLSPFNLNEERNCGFEVNAQGERVSWKGRVPIIMYTHKSYPSEDVGALLRAMEVWNSVRAGLFSYGGVVEGILSPRQDGKNVVYWFDTWGEDNRVEQGQSAVYMMGDEIKESDILINAKDYVFFTDTTVNPLEGVHLESLLVHELGHVLGLAHITYTESVMDPNLAELTRRVEPTQIDISHIHCEY